MRWWTKDRAKCLLLDKARDLFGLDLRSLALFRIGLALLLLTDLGVRATSLRAHYTDSGVLPRVALKAESRASIHMLGGAVPFEAGLFVIAGLFAAALLVGYRTRLATAASWFFLLSVHGRNPLVLQGGDTLFRLLLFWGMFLPLGARSSLDAMRERPRLQGRKNALSAATVALILQICFMYWFSAAWKSDPAWRTEGTAVYYALSLDEFATRIGRFLLMFPLLLKLLTFATLALEAFGPALLFVPVFNGRLRLLVVGMFLFFHAGLQLCMTLGLFPLICGVAWLALLPGCFWDWVTRMPRWVPCFRGNRAIALSVATPPRKHETAGSFMLSRWLSAGCAACTVAAKAWDPAKKAQFHTLPQP